MFSLRGMLTCPKCGRRYVAETHKHGRFSYYRCSSAARWGLQCNQKMVPDHEIQDQVLKLFKKMTLPDEIITLARLQIQQMEEQQQKLLDDRLEGLIDKDLCYKKLSQIQRDLDLANVRLKEIQDDNNANYMALNKTIDVLEDLYKLYKSSDTPTRHVYHKAFFEAIVVDQKKIVALKMESSI